MFILIINIIIVIIYIVIVIIVGLGTQVRVPRCARTFPQDPLLLLLPPPAVYYNRRCHRRYRYYRRRTTGPMRLQLGAGLRQYPLTVRQMRREKKLLRNPGTRLPPGELEQDKLLLQQNG